MNNEEFYLKMVSLSLQNDNFEALRSAIESRDLGKAFEAAHALRGILGNMGLTQLHDPIAEITEKLRERKDIDYSSCIDTFF